MAFQDIQNDVLTILNRDDCTAAMAQAFVLQGMALIQREVRLPSMERQALITPTATLDWVPVPADLIEPIDILVPDQFEALPAALTKKPYRKLMRMDPANWPCAYARYQGQFWIRGQVPVGNLIQILYYGTFSPFTTPASENELSLSAPDLATYAALAYAGDQFQHPNVETWRGRYVSLRDGVKQAAEDVDAEGGPQAVEPMYHDNFYWENGP